MTLRIPLVLAVVVTATTAVVTAVNCGGGKGGPLDATTDCFVFCVPDGSGGGSNCDEPTCATGSNLDMCPAGCVPEPVV